ncbi:hypothetical protein KCP78_20125 [Salmonella enterica subsp. enterica]|nr:hypothetical protein KCP78_20125 [Salmonella enterica subsp. enterica]
MASPTDCSMLEARSINSHRNRRQPRRALEVLEKLTRFKRAAAALEIKRPLLSARTCNFFHCSSRRAVKPMAAFR